MSRNKENDFPQAQTGEHIEIHLPSLSPSERRRRRQSGKCLPFTLVAALLAPVVIVGCSTLITHNSQNKPPALLEPVTAPGLYAYLQNSVYRLDNRTHQVLWKHIFPGT